MEFQPFYVGQEVEVIKDHSMGRFKVGDRFKILSIEKTCCNKWCVDIGLPHLQNVNGMICCICRKEYLSNSPLFNSASFRAITNNFQSISLSEVLEKETYLIGEN